MAVLRRQTRMIAFRISEEDYNRLYNLCVNLGARSVSDLVRSAVKRLIGCEQDGVDPLMGHIEILNRKVTQLTVTVDELSNRLAASGQAAGRARLPG